MIAVAAEPGSGIAMVIAIAAGLLTLALAKTVLEHWLTMREHPDTGARATPRTRPPSPADRSQPGAPGEDPTDQPPASAPNLIPPATA